MESLASKYRPHKFEDVCGQTSIVKILNRQLELNEIKNTYLFCGASGCGKTTIARIFASNINNGCGSPIEIDGASNNGVDNVKQIIKSASERSIDSKYKVYIIDECHALTNQAWQAFLKCIEEPPTYTIFIFCTTDPQKIPSTILNRCMRFNFNRIQSSVIKQRLLDICNNEGFTDYIDTCDYISRICKGQLRDAISCLEKCASYDTCLCIDNALQAIGNYSYDTMFKLVNYLIDCDEPSVLSILSDIYNEGNDLKLFVDQFLCFCLDVSKYALMHNYEVTQIPSTLEEELKRATSIQNSTHYYFYLVNSLLELKNMVKTDTDIRSTVEVQLMKICRLQ